MKIKLVLKRGKWSFLEPAKSFSREAASMEESNPATKPSPGRELESFFEPTNSYSRKSRTGADA